jgi:hypothetical protein
MKSYINLLIILTAIIFISACNRNNIVSITPTFTPTRGRTGLPTYTQSPITHNHMIVPVLCSLKNRPIERLLPYNTEIILSWGWEATTEDLIMDFIKNNETIITLDNWRINEGVDYEIRKTVGGDMYEVIWSKDIGLLSPGMHYLIYDVKFSKPISDGVSMYGPGTDIENLHDECRLNIK